MKKIALLVIVSLVSCIAVNANNVDNDLLIRSKIGSNFNSLKLSSSRKAPSFTNLLGTHDLSIDFGSGLFVKKLDITRVITIDKKTAAIYFDFLNEDGSISNSNQLGVVAGNYLYFHWALFDAHNYFVIKYKLNGTKLTGSGFMMAFESLLNCSIPGSPLPGDSVSCTILNPEDINSSITARVNLY